MTQQEFFNICIKEFNPSKYVSEEGRLDIIFEKQDIMLLINYFEEEDLVLYTGSIYSKREMFIQDFIKSDEFIIAIKQYLDNE